MRASADQIKGMRARGESRSDWNAAAALTADDIERLTLEDEGAAPAGWESTVEIGIPTTKQAVHLRLDRDVLGWFRSYGPGYQTRINAVLRAFMSARQHAERAEHKPR